MEPHARGLGSNDPRPVLDELALDRSTCGCWVGADQANQQVEKSIASPALPALVTTRTLKALSGPVSAVASFGHPRGKPGSSDRTHGVAVAL